MSKALHFLVVDDHAIVREGTAQLMERHWPGSTVALAADWPQARAFLAEAGRLDLVLLDLHVPGVRRLEALRELRQSYPLYPVAVLSGDTDPSLAQQALRLGAAGFVPKAEDTAVLLQAIELILDGGCYVPTYLAGLDALADPGGDAAAAAQPDSTLLTPRQRDVLGCLVRGLANKEIARALGLSEPTVKAHLVCIFRVLRVKNRAQAAMAAQAWLNAD